MMWKIIRCLTVCGLLSAGQAQAASYICQLNGKAVFASEKIGADCQLSVMNGISGEADGTAASADYDAVSRVVEKEMFGAYDDVKILPRTEPAVASRPAAAPRLEVRLRNGGNGGKKAAARVPVRAAAPVRAAPPAAAMPAVRPQLSRRQILQREIGNERAALNSAKARLEAAKRSGGNTAALLQTVRDREANLRALQRELGS
ncbi:hypothetical protein [Neisseria leonii]|uniref:hypothetical protein n=1 Tax=Neisseria leonii TaxID=2995413 RepID=UPI00237C3ABA|nr:hypothetical protein [Neisseria sp. 3986]MDD9326035.1 hypothetical protein [Neisseria sp. 3986]